MSRLSSQVVAGDVSDTHVLAAWSQVGLSKPESAVKTYNMHRKVKTILYYLIKGKNSTLSHIMCPKKGILFFSAAVAAFYNLKSMIISDPFPCTNSLIFFYIFMKPSLTWTYFQESDFK